MRSGGSLVWRLILRSVEEYLKGLSHFHSFILSHFQTFTFSLSHFHSFTLSHFHSFAFSHFHALTLLHHLPFALSLFNTVSLSHSHTLVWRLMRRSMEKYLKGFSYFHTFTLSLYCTFTLSHFHTFKLLIFGIKGHWRISEPLSLWESLWSSISDDNELRSSLMIWMKINENW